MATVSFRVSPIILFIITVVLSCHSVVKTISMDANDLLIHEVLTRMGATSWDEAVKKGCRTREEIDAGKLYVVNALQLLNCYSSDEECMPTRITLSRWNKMNCRVKSDVCSSGNAVVIKQIDTVVEEKKLLLMNSDNTTNCPPVTRNKRKRM